MKRIYYLLAMGFLFQQCITKSADQNEASGPTSFINTVTGAIHPDSLGLTLVHEHVLVDFIGADSTGYHRWDREQVVERVLPFILEAKKRGVKTIIEMTPAYLGRDPKILKDLSEHSGVNIITNTGLYGAVNDKYLPDYAFSISTDSLARLWMAEFNSGIEDTGIRPGFIKISVDRDSILSPVDRKLLEAAIEVHRQTGIPIVSHTGPDGPAFAQLKVLEEEGISPAAWVWTHAQNGTDKGRIAAAKKGSWISLDNIMADNIDHYVAALNALKKKGLLDHVLISHDAGYYEPDKPFGGEFRGYTAIFTHLLPALLEEGYTEDEFKMLLTENPKRAYMPTLRVLQVKQ